MGMTIEKAIEGLHDIQKCYNDDSDAMFFGFDDKDNKSVDFAIETMRKYQQISNVVKFANDNELGYEYIGEKVYEVSVYDR